MSEIEELKDEAIRYYMKKIKEYSPNLKKIGYFFRKMRLEILKFTMFERVLRYYLERKLISPMQEYEFRKKVLSQTYVDYRISIPRTEDDEDDDYIIDEDDVYSKYSLEVCIAFKKRDMIAKTR